MAQRIALVAASAMFAYGVLLGGTALGEVQPGLRAFNAFVAGIVILIAISNASEADRADRWVVVALALFVVAALFAVFPRQALDAVLTALTYVAVFLVARRQLRHSRWRRGFILTCMALSCLVTLVTAARWFPLVIEWMDVTQWALLPPLNIHFPATPWGHRHDLALLTVMLYPAWWTGKRGPIHTALAVVIGAIVAAVVIVDGSRMLWVALGGATVLVLGPATFRRLRTLPREWRLRTVAAAVAVVALAGVGGFGRPVIERLAAMNTIEARGSLWEAATTAWLDRPVAGAGPGSFPWILQLTDYFDTNGWAPRHPDSLLFQLLPEAGLLGLAAVVLIAIATVPALWRSPHRLAVWPLFVFALACLGANPTDFGFLVLPAILWVAFAMPRIPARDAISGSIAFRSALFLTAAVAGLAVVPLVAAGIVYARGAEDVGKAELQRAERAFATAAALDPGMAIYPRQLGTVHLLLGKPDEAISALSKATALSPVDDAAWRTLGLAYIEAGDEENARRAVRAALDAQRSDITNLMIEARFEAPGSTRHYELVSEIVQTWPMIVASPHWPALGADVPPRDAIRLGLERWESGLPTPIPMRVQPLLLHAWVGADGKESEIFSADMSDELTRAVASVWGCEADARSRLADTSENDRRRAEYWLAVARQSAREGATNHDAIRAFEIMTSTPIDRDAIGTGVNPLHAGSADAWGYRREPIAWPAHGPHLPSPNEGMSSLVASPAARDWLCHDGH